ncbi:hypothetical protein RCL1_003166 [Eukaryota sp. TZLM3-RCL]
MKRKLYIFYILLFTSEAMASSPRLILKSLDDHLASSAPRKTTTRSSLSLDSKQPEHAHPSIPSWANVISVSSKTLSSESPSQTPPLSEFPLRSQEFILTQSLLAALSGCQNEVILLTELQDASFSSSLSSITRGCDPALLSLINYCLPLVSSLTFLRHFCSTRLQYSYGTVIQATCSRVGQLIDDFDLLIAQIDQKVQQLLPEIFPLAKVIAILSNHNQSLIKLGELFLSLNNVPGSVFLSSLITKSLEFRGDSAFPVFNELITSAMIPFVVILKKFICKGVIDDPYSEFFVVKDPKSQFSIIKDKIPFFLVTLAETILECGLFVMIATQSRIIDPLFGDDTCPINKRLNPNKPPFPCSREFSSIIFDCHKWASSIALKSIYDSGLINFLNESIKYYYLLDSGEWVLHFMEMSLSDLMAPSTSVDPQRLSFLFEILSSKQSKHVPKVEILPYSIYGHVLAILNTQANPDASVLSFPLRVADSKPLDPKRLSALEAMTITIEAPFPLNLILTPMVLQKLSLLFRYFLMLRYTERVVVSLWCKQDAFRKTFKLQKKNTEITQETVFFAKVLKYRQQMLHFIQSILHYCSFSTVEPTWKIMLINLNSATTPLELKKVFNEFIDDLLRQCLLTNQEIFVTISKALKTADLFCRFVNRMYSTGLEAIEYETSIETISRYGSDFEGHVVTLIRNVSILAQKEHALGVESLLSMLCFGDFYSK